MLVSTAAHTWGRRNAARRCRQHHLTPRSKSACVVRGLQLLEIPPGSSSPHPRWRPERGRRADRQTGRQAGRQTDRQTDRQTETLLGSNVLQRGCRTKGLCKGSKHGGAVDTPAACACAYRPEPRYHPPDEVGRKATHLHEALEAHRPQGVNALFYLPRLLPAAPSTCRAFYLPRPAVFRRLRPLCC